MTAIVHQRKTAQREQAEQDQKRWRQPERSLCRLKHEPPQHCVGKQGVADLNQGFRVAGLAEGLQAEVLVGGGLDHGALKTD